MCEAKTCENQQQTDRTCTKGRIKLWKIEGGLQCAIVGTCLSHEDLLRLAPKVGIEIDANREPYDVHGFFVHNASSDTPIARALHKLLDQRFGGIVRKVSRLSDADALQALWNAEYEAGRLPGAFWAFMSCANVPSKIAHAVFGEVHMLSHLLGKATHRKAEEAASFEALLKERDDQLKRLRDKHALALNDRDQRIAELTAKLADAEQRKPTASVSMPAQTILGTQISEQKLARRDRALVGARERARSAEAELVKLSKRFKQLEALLRRKPIEQDVLACPGAEACELKLPDARPKPIQKLLYLGGRRGSLDQLRDVAKSCATDFLHHDGGIEDAFHRIDKLVESCDAVFCPIDCVSHSACQHAKKLCQKHCKAFITLRSSGQTSFARALEDFVSET
ncbi:MAG: DUF2325 domain-containing protein [Pseudomonadota bacterium]